MIKYGVEHITKDKDSIVVYNSKDVAMEKAEELARGLSSGESVMLFYADCDADGKLVSTEYNVLKVWSK